MGKTWRLLLCSKVAPIKAPESDPAPVTGVRITLSGILVRIVFPWTTRLSFWTEMLEVIVIVSVSNNRENKTLRNNKTRIYRIQIASEFD